MMWRRMSTLFLLACPACEQHARHVTRIEGSTMGTTYSLQIIDMPATHDESELHAAVDGALRAVEGKMSTYDPESELSRFNASHSTTWFEVSADTVNVVEEALRISRLTGGAFDVSVAPLVDLWGFGPHGQRRRPAPAAIATALDSVGYERLETRPEPPSIRKGSAGMRVDLSAIAKGFAVDQVARLLDDRGARDYLIEVGGELRASGLNLAGLPWRIAVDQPRGPQSMAPCLLDLVDRAVASSGDYRNAFEEEGVRHAHVIDPRSGHPTSAGVACATVLSSTTMEADAFATALMVLDPDDGLRLAEQAGLDARLLVRLGESLVERSTPGFPGRALGGPP